MLLGMTASSERTVALGRWATWQRAFSGSMRQSHLRMAPQLDQVCLAPSGRQTSVGVTAIGAVFGVVQRRDNGDTAGAAAFAKEPVETTSIPHQVSFRAGDRGLGV